jgi:hypothetical protein
MNIPGFLSDRSLASLTYPQARGRGVVIPSLSSDLENCAKRCADDPDFEFCECLCRNERCSSGRCPLRPCWPSF